MYCNIVWGSCATYLLHKLFLLQKRAVRAITNSHYLDHTRNLFLKLKILDIYDINNLQVAIFMYSFCKNVLPDLFKEYFIYNRDVNKYETRNTHKLYVPFYRYNFARSQVSYKGPIIWNMLPDEFKQCPNIFNFKKKYKGFLINKLLQ